MCGIVGLVNPEMSAVQVRQCTQRMSDPIRHRGPDDEGHQAMLAFGIGMRRLSIIDLSGGQQPISNEAANIHVVCNGEIYNFIELRDDLVARGHRFRSGSDTEVIVHLYEEYGDECLQHLRGMFALAILDTRQKGRLLIARDRLGKKPLFYVHRNNELLFASEMKSLLAVDSTLAEPDYSTLGEYLQFGYLRQPRTIYKEIHRLPGAHYGIFEDGSFRIARYWRLDYQPDESLSESAWQERLEECLAESVRIRLRSDVPLGIFLSGGLDSSAVVAFASQTGLEPLQTFTVKFDQKEWDESEDALAVAKHFGTQHHQLSLDATEMRESLHEALLKITTFFDEPFGDDSALPTYFISKMASEHVKVVLSGDGGDELFGGYSFYRGMLFSQYYHRWLPNWLGRYGLPTVVRLLARMAPASFGSRGLHVAKVLRDSSLPLQQAYRNKACSWQPEEICRLLTPDLLPHVNFMGPQYLPDDLWQVLMSDQDLVSRLIQIDTQSYLQDDILVKVDRMSMAHSLEVRSPLLDHRLAELAAKMPTKMKIRGGSGKFLLRKVLKDKLPTRSLRKGKQGFGVPLRDWFRSDLAEWVRDFLGPGGSLPEEIFCQTEVQTVLRQHQRGERDNGRKIWLLLAFAAWHQQYQCRSTTDFGRADNFFVPCSTRNKTIDTRSLPEEF